MTLLPLILTPGAPLEEEEPPLDDELDELELDELEDEELETGVQVGVATPLPGQVVPFQLHQSLPLYCHTILLQYSSCVTPAEKAAGCPFFCTTPLTTVHEALVLSMMGYAEPLGEGAANKFKAQIARAVPSIRRFMVGLLCWISV